MLKKQKQYYKNLVGKYGRKEGIVLFALRYVNRKKYYSILIQKIKKEYSLFLEEMKNIDEVKKEKIHNKINVWVLWYQGEKEAPFIVKKCIKRMQEIYKKTEYNLIILTKDNLKNYVDIPKYISEKIEKEIITKTNFSDYIRAYLLYTYGGIWLDATCYILENKALEYEKYYFYSQKYKKGKSKFFNDGKWSSFYLISGKNNPVMFFLYNFWLEYWKNNDYLVDYFLVDIILEIGYEEIHIIHDIIDEVPENNEGIMYILENWNKEGNINSIKNILKDTNLIKLDWRKGKKTTRGNEVGNIFIEQIME